MIGQATAHRRANAFAQALEDAAVPGETTGEHGAGGAPGTDTHGTDDGRAGRESRETRDSRDGRVGHEGREVNESHGSQRGHGGHAGGGHGAHAASRHADPEQAAMVSLAAALSSRPRPAMDPQKKTVQRAQLIAAMEQAIADGSFETTRRVPEQRSDSATGRRATGPRGLGPRSRLSRRLAVGGLTVGVAAGAFGGVAAASTNALPGDTLYGLKRGMEDLKLDLAGGDASRGKVYLDMAATRMQEARRLMDRGRGGTLDDESVGEVRKALSGMHQEASEGHRLLTEAYRQDGSLQPIELLNSFSETHRQSWRDLRGKLPSQLTDVSDQVSSVFDAIDQEVAPLQSLLPKPKHSAGPSSPGSSDSSGPSGTGGHDGGGSSGIEPSAPSPSAPASGPTGPAGGSGAGPSPSSTAPGLIGGNGNLLGPPPTTPPAVPGSPTSTPSPTSHSVVLPPLLPGLLPGLGLGDESTDQ